MKFVLQLGFLPDAPEDVARSIAPFVEAMVQANMNFLKHHPTTPGLYQSKVSYKEETPWRDIAAMLKTKKGSCHSLVAWRIAELRMLGEQAKIHISFIKLNGVEWFHIQVKRLFPKPHIEDPSKKLGMVL